MGKNELEHLRKEAEQAMADAERWTDNEGMVAVARTLMYGFALLADRLPRPRIEMATPTITMAALDKAIDNCIQARLKRPPAKQDFCRLNNAPYVRSERDGSHARNRRSTQDRIPILCEQQRTRILQPLRALAGKAQSARLPDGKLPVQRLEWLLWDHAISRCSMFALRPDRLTAYTSWTGTSARHL